MSRETAVRPQSLRSSSSDYSTEAQDADAFCLPPEASALSFPDFIRSTASVSPLAQDVYPTLSALRRDSSHALASTYPHVTTTDAAEHQPFRPRLLSKSSASSDSDLLQPTGTQTRKPSLQRSQAFPPRRPSMVSEQYSPKTRSRAASISSCYAMPLEHAQSEASLAPSFNRPPAEYYNSDNFSPTAAVFQDSPHCSDPVSPMLPAGDPSVRIREHLLPHEHIARHKRKFPDIGQRHDLLAKTSGYFTPTSGSQSTRSPAYGTPDHGSPAFGTPVNESAPFFNDPLRSGSEGSVVKHHHDNNASRTFNEESYDVPTPLTANAGYMSRRESSGREQLRQNSPTLRALTGLQLSERSDSRSSSGKSSQRKEEDEALVRNSVRSEVSDFTQRLNDTFGGLDSTKMPMPHEPWKDPAARLSYETSKRSSFIDRVRSVRSKGSVRTSKSSYTQPSPSTFGSHYSHDTAASSQSPASTTTSPTAQSPFGLPAIQSTTSLLTYEKSANSPISPDSARCVSDGRALEIKAPAEKGKKKFLALRHTPSILKHRQKRSPTTEEEDGKASNANSPQSASSSAPVSPLGSSGPFPSVAKPKLKKKGSKMKLQISSPLPGSMTNGEPLEPNSKSWLERRDEAKREKKHEDLKKKIKKVSEQNRATKAVA